MRVATAFQALTLLTAVLKDINTLQDVRGELWLVTVAAACPPPCHELVVLPEQLKPVGMPALELELELELDVVTADELLVVTTTDELDELEDELVEPTGEP